MSILSIDLHSSKSTIRLSFHFQNVTLSKPSSDRRLHEAETGSRLTNGSCAMSLNSNHVVLITMPNVFVDVGLPTVDVKMTLLDLSPADNCSCWQTSIGQSVLVEYGTGYEWHPSNQALQYHVVTIRCYPWSAGSWQVFYVVSLCVFSHQLADYSIVVGHLTSNSFEWHPCCMHADYFPSLCFWYSPSYHVYWEWIIFLKHRT